MWLVINRETKRVYAAETVHPPAGAYNEAIFEIKEWYGPVPNLGDPLEGIEADLDPTLDDPDYPAFAQARIDYDGLADKADAQVKWLDETIPDIDTMTATEVRDVVKRLARQNRETMKAWRYVLRRFR